jgi:predicted naringenin-chalcone synthase
MSNGTTPFGVILAGFKPVMVHPLVPQQPLLDHMAWGMAVVRCAQEHITSPRGMADVLEEVKAAVHRYGVSPDQVRQRQVCILPPLDISDGQSRIPQTFTGVLANIRERPEGPSLDERMVAFRALLEEFLEKHYPANISPPDDILHVCTTGYMLPSPVQRMVVAREWNTTVTHSYHMGCYGTFPAVRTAVGILASGHTGVFGVPKNRVDLINTEPVSLHIDLTRTTPANLVTASLFGDGFITYSAYSESEAARQGVHGLRVLASHDQILPNSSEDMKLTPGAHQFDMVLSIRVPVRIQKGILPFVNELCRRAGIDFGKEKDSLALAIHPGGTKILEVVADALRVDPKKLDVSFDVLRDHGNMASATIPHVWHRIMADDSIKPGTRVLSVAFGPGLTVTGMVLEKT